MSTATPPPPEYFTRQTHLQGVWLVLGRLLWVLVLVMSLWLFAAAFPAGIATARQILPDLQFPLVRPAIIFYLIAIDLFVLGFTLVSSTILFLRQSDNWVALLDAQLILAFGAILSFSVAALVIQDPAWSPMERALRFVAEGCALVAAYVFPDGRFVPRWTRPLAAFLVGWLFFTYLVPLLGPHLSPNLLAILPVNWPPFLTFLWRAGWLSTILVAQGYRYWRASTANQRQQTKWVLFGLFILVLTFLMTAFAQLLAAIVGHSWLDAALVLVVQPLQKAAFLLVPLTIGLSVLRYRLWEVDFVINRSLVYGTLTLLLAALFGSLLFLVARLFQALSGGQQSAIAIGFTALLFGILFQPVRRRVQQFVDRRFYGINIDYKAEAPAPSSSPPPTGPISTFGRMTLIGRGGNAEVYKAHHPSLNRPVAIKVLPARLAGEAEFRQRFTREAQTIANLHHPNIIQVFDFGTENGVYYMVLEYISGPNLGSYLAAQGRLTLGQTLTLVQPLASALDHAHAHGLVHRDLKPANIMLDPQPLPAGGLTYRPVLTDFGIAKLLDSSTVLTQAGGIVGTFEFIAPEQIQARPDIDARTDVYALGVVVYQLLTGRLPFTARNAGALLIAHLNQPPPDPRQYTPNLPDFACRAVLKALSKNRNHRFNSAGAFARALARQPRNPAGEQTLLLPRG
jgi:tRNA A-37 threonylcarbamoyl transferase component Bud32